MSGKGEKTEFEQKLEKLADPGIVERRGEMLRALPEASGILAKAAGAAKRLLSGGGAAPGQAPIGLRYAAYEERAKQARRGWEAYCKLKPKERLEFCRRLYPQLGDLIEPSLEILRRGPVAKTFARLACRAPRNPELTDAACMNWFVELPRAVGPYDQPIEWHAEWISHMNNGWGFEKTMSVLLAAAIDAGGEQGRKVRSILIDSAAGRHAVGRMGHHIPLALLLSSDPECWSFIESMLLAAQREEGLRQSILECVQTSHPEAFRRMLRLILDHDLARFSSVARAMDVWLGFLWDSQSPAFTHRILKRLLELIEDPAARKEAIVSGRGEDFYLALFAIGFEDLPSALAAAEPVIANDRDVERQAAGLYYWLRSELPISRELAERILADKDIRLGCMLNASVLENAMRASDGLPAWFEKIKRFIGRLPDKPAKLEQLIWPWVTPDADRGVFYQVLIRAADATMLERLIGEADGMELNARHALAWRIDEFKDPSPIMLDAMVRMAGDASSDVRDKAIAFLAKHDVREADAPLLEAYLTRKADKLRKGVIALLLKQSDTAALASAERLLASNQRLQKLAGLELLRHMADAKRCEKACREMSARFGAEEAPKGAEEASHMAAIRERPAVELSIENGFGLYDPADRTPPRIPEKKNLFLDFRVAAACLADLDRLAEEHAEDKIVTSEIPESEDRRLFEKDMRFPFPISDKPLEADLARLPLREVWEEWFKGRPADLRDPDGMELIRAAWLISKPGYQYFLPNSDRNEAEIKARTAKDPVRRALYGDAEPVSLRWSSAAAILNWHIKVCAGPSVVAFVLDALEYVLASVPKEALWTRVLTGDPKASWFGFAMADWRENHVVKMAFSHAELVLNLRSDLWTAADKSRLWRLHHWQSWPVKSAPRPGEAWWRIPYEIKEINKGAKEALETLLVSNKTYPFRSDGPAIPFRLAVEAVAAREASQADVIEQLLRPTHEIGNLTRRTNPYPWTQGHPWLAPLVDRMRERFLEIEYERGDAPTAVSAIVRKIEYVPGRRHFVRLLQVLERHELKRERWTSGDERSSQFSHLLRVCFPEDDDTPEAFAESLREAGIEEKRLIEASLFAPQWSGLLETVLGWEGLEDAVWWIWAHLRHSAWGVSKEFTQRWEGRVTESTALRAEDLIDGAVDVEWFRRVRERLGEARLENVIAAARYASDSLGHTRARQFAEAMMGKLKTGDLIERMTKKRHQDTVRALGLVPLAEGEARRADMLARYEALKEFLRTSKKFGSMRRTSEKRAVETGMANLARTAGFPDPLRLEWAMEQEAVADLALGPVKAVAGKTEVALSIDASGSPELEARQGEKLLKAIPPAAKKDAAVKALVARRQDLNRQRSRMRLSLEESMCRGDAFSAKELAELMHHPLLRPMLADLVFIGEAGLGTPALDGLIGADGSQVKTAGEEALRIAHPCDFLSSGQWPAWQRNCFVRERVQPFKQIFRELYVVTQAEREDGKASRRYAGQQVQPRQALALLGQRGWVTSGEGGGVRRTYHAERLTAELEFMEHFYTAAEVEGLTLEALHFRPAHEWKELALSEIPPRIFSEAMRDLDLAVSVAHRGGVDPEASQSTIEMRASLLEETLAVLKHANVRIDGRHALIEGKLARYSVHLGSGVVHVIPGGSLVIVPVGAQHRGRLFLPFADDDPRTAEILSKILLLAEDKKIKDPFLLEQIRALAR